LRLFCQKVVVLLAVATLGCSDSLSPRAVSGFYELQSVNGQPLPVELSAIPEESMSVTGGSLILTPEGYATTLEHREQVDQNGTTFISFSGLFTFELDGNEITLIPICPPNALALCGTLEGVISGSEVVLTFGSSTYEYTRTEEF
jgi:hypothetical protein